MPSIIVVPRTDKKNQRGEVPLRFQINHADWRTYVSLGLSIRLQDWNTNKREARKSHPREERFNKLLTSKLEKAQDAILGLREDDLTLTPERVRRVVKRAIDPEAASGKDFFAFSRGRVKMYEGREQFARAETLRIIVDKLELFHGKRSRRPALPFELIDVRFVEDFVTFLVTERKNGPTTVAKNLKGLRTLLRSAMREGLMSRESDPFFHIQVHEPIPKKKKLSVAEIDAMAAVELEKGSALWHARNYFLFSHYTAGLRFSDVARIRWQSIRHVIGEYRLAYRAQKTKEHNDVLLLPPARTILSLYEWEGASPTDRVFPILDGYDTSTAAAERRAVQTQNAIVNRHLKRLQKKAGVQTHVTFHMARHSFADRARKAGWSLHTIKDALGHANLAVTERYLAGFDSDVLDDRMRDLFSDVE